MIIIVYQDQYFPSPLVAYGIAWVSWPTLVTRRAYNHADVWVFLRGSLVSTPGVLLENSSEESGMRPKSLTLFRAKTNHFPWKGFKIFDTKKKKVSSSFSLTLLTPVYFKTVLAQ